jgi:hypothetical protein
VPSEPSWWLTTALAAVGLTGMFARLRAEFSVFSSTISVVLIAGATPLFREVFQLGSLPSVAAFTVLAIAAYMLVSFRVPPAMSVPILSTLTLAAVAVTAGHGGAATLFSASSGFLSLTPVVYVAVVSTLISVRARPAEAVATAAALIAFPLLNASPVPALAVLGSGMTDALDFVRRRPLVATAPIVAAFIVWNYWLMVQYTMGSLPKDSPFRFADMVRQQAAVHTRQPFVYPFAIPGSVVSAWRQGIPLSRADDLMAEPLGDAFELTLDSSADRFLLDGWGPLGTNASGSFRRPVADRATLVFPLRTPTRDVLVELVVAGAAASANAPVLHLDLNGQPLGSVHLSADSPVRLRIESSRVGALFRTGYNRLSIVTSSAARPAIYRLRIAPAA